MIKRVQLSLVLAVSAISLTFWGVADAGPPEGSARSGRSDRARKGKSRKARRRKARKARRRKARKALPAAARPGARPAGTGSPAGGKPGAGATAAKKKAVVYLVAVLPSELKPHAPADLEAKFRNAVSSGLAAAKHKVTSFSDMERVRLEFPLVDQCTKGTCLVKLTNALNTELLVRLKVVRTGKNYEATLALLDPMGRLKWKKQDWCDICTLREALSTVKNLGKGLGAWLRIQTRPVKPRPGPKVRPCTFDKECKQGELCHKGMCMDARKVIPLRPPRKKVKLRPRPKVRPKPKVKVKVKPRRMKRRHNWGTLSLVTGGAAVVFFSVGAGLMVADGKPSCDRPNPRYTCRERYRTKGAGAAMLALGAAGAAAAGVFTYLWVKNRFFAKRTKRKKKKTKVSFFLMPIPGRGAVASAGVRF